MVYSRGSEWRRWDIHIHTPGTMKNDQYEGSTIDEKWDKFYEDINNYVGDETDPERTISVIGITDYFSIDNYKKVIADDRLPKSVDLVLPNVELRITPVTGSGSPINVHCIFNPEIEDKLDAIFFSNLDILGTNNPAGRSGLINYGRELANKMNIDGVNDATAIKMAIENCVVNFSDLETLFASNAELRDNTIIGVSNSSRDGVSGCRQHRDYMETLSGTGSQLDSVIRRIFRLSDIIFSGNPKNRDFFLGLTENANEKFIEENYGSLKPCFHGSDAHTNEDIFNPNLERFCWVKADPTFQGLKQIVNEPKERIFIGKIPEALTRVRKNSTKYLKSIRIGPVEENPNDVWFKDINIPLNTGLVAIIGNKGSGKSALADIIGLCTDAQHSTDFQFLNKQRFLKKGYANRFDAQVEFFSNKTTEKRPLNHPIDETSISQVQYLPQSYFEKVCNEIGKVEAFRKEVEQVVFHHIPEEHKLGQGTFTELLDFKKNPINQEIRLVKVEILKLNEQIIQLEDKGNPEYRETLQNKKRLKLEEIKAHEEQKPKPVQKPEEDEDELTSSDRRELEEWEKRKEKYENRKTLAESRISNLRIQITELEGFKRDLKSKREELRSFNTSHSEIARKYDLEWDEMFKITVNLKPLQGLIHAKNSEMDNLQTTLGEEKLELNKDFQELSLRSKILFCNHKINEITTKLSAAVRKYQQYLIEKGEWEKKLEALVGKPDMLDTLEYYKRKLEYIDNELNVEIQNKREERLVKTEDILEKKLEVKEFYEQIKESIDKKLALYEDQALTIDSTLSLRSNFVDSFMGFVDKGRQGSFKGVVEGTNRLEELISAVEWECSGSVGGFLSSIIYNLEFDCREDNDRKPMFIGSQIQQRKEFYDYLFTLDYLESNYELKQGDKTLEELSPGEKGALLLIFYLTLDKDDIPLLIDQPEDNLDNKSVATVLVPYIREAKERRQIIMVTHNPNLAVVADAEQIIKVSIDKENKNEFAVIAGSIENPKINQAVVEVLEGTMPAFTTRKNKYTV